MFFKKESFKFGFKIRQGWCRFKRSGNLFHSDGAAKEKLLP